MLMMMVDVGKTDFRAPKQDGYMVSTQQRVDVRILYTLIS